MWEKKRLPGSSGDAGTIRSKVKLPDLSIFPWLLAFPVVSPAVSSLNSMLKNLIIPLDITFASVSPYTLLSLLREIITFSMFFSFHFHIRTTEHKNSVIILPTGAILNSWSLTSGGPFCCLAISITDWLPPISQCFLSSKFAITASASYIAKKTKSARENSRKPSELLLPFSYTCARRAVFSRALGHISLLCRNITAASPSVSPSISAPTPQPSLVTTPLLSLPSLQIGWFCVEVRLTSIIPPWSSHSFEGYHASSWTVAGSGGLSATEQSDVAPSALGTPDQIWLLPFLCWAWARHTLLALLLLHWRLVPFTWTFGVNGFQISRPLGRFSFLAVPTCSVI